MCACLGDVAALERRRIPIVARCPHQARVAHLLVDVAGASPHSVASTELREMAEAVANTPVLQTPQGPDWFAMNCMHARHRFSDIPPQIRRRLRALAVLETTRMHTPQICHRSPTMQLASRDGLREWFLYAAHDRRWRWLILWNRPEAARAIIRRSTRNRRERWFSRKRRSSCRCRRTRGVARVSIGLGLAACVSRERTRSSKSPSKEDLSRWGRFGELVLTVVLLSPAMGKVIGHLWPQTPLRPGPPRPRFWHDPQYVVQVALRDDGLGADTCNT